MCTHRNIRFSSTSASCPCSCAYIRLIRIIYIIFSDVQWAHAYIFLYCRCSPLLSLISPASHRVFGYNTNMFWFVPAYVHNFFFAMFRLMPITMGYFMWLPFCLYTNIFVVGKKLTNTKEMFPEIDGHTHGRQNHYSFVASFWTAHYVSLIDFRAMFTTYVPNVFPCRSTRCHVDGDTT